MRTRCSWMLSLLVLVLVCPAANAKGSQASSPQSGAPPHTLVPPVNDRCDGAILLQCGNISLAGTTNPATDDYTFPDSTLSCTGFTADGRDVVYKLNVGPGDSLWIDYRSTADGSIYLVTDCNNITASCVTGSDKTQLPNELESLRYGFTVGGTYYMILDSYGANSSGDWTAVGQLVCGASSPPRNDLCEAALRITCGAINLSGSTQFAHNNNILPDSPSSCTAHKADGYDVAYQLTVAAEDSIWVDYTSTSDGSIYIVADCNNSAGTCITGVDQNPAGEIERLRFRFSYSGTYYLIMDSRDSDSYGDWTAVGSLDCINPPPSNDRCDGKLWIRCGEFAYSGSTALAVNDYSFLNPSTACTGYPTDGYDVMYQIYASAGDSIRVDYTSSTDGSIYIVTNCDDVENSCVAGMDAAVSGDPETLRYTFPSQGTYYLILDSVELDSFGNWTCNGQLYCPEIVGVAGQGTPGRLALGQAAPNPFGGTTTIPFALPAAGKATLRVYDLGGRLVRTLVDGPIRAGHHRATWDGRDDLGRKVGPGVYFARLWSAGQESARRMVFAN